MGLTLREEYRIKIFYEVDSNYTHSVALLHKRTIWSNDRRLPAKLMPTSADRWCHVVSVTDSYGRILGFLDRTCCVNPIDNSHYAPITTTPSTRTKYITLTLTNVFTVKLTWNISLEHSQKVFHQTTRTKHFPRTPTQITSLEHSQKVLQQTTRTKHFPRIPTQITSLEQSHKALHFYNSR
jgi:hypothetical protein